jgi:hypothetical protein
MDEPLRTSRGSFIFTISFRTHAPSADSLFPLLFINS